jgi:hypothetical protein
MPQQALFELNGALVVSHIAGFGATSYQIANIGSVSHGLPENGPAKFFAGPMVQLAAYTDRA